MKMSDALRGAAETAPVESVHVSVGAVKSRAGRNRALRAGANGVVGVGAAALVFAGVMGVVANQTSLAAAEDMDSGKVTTADGGAPAPNIGAADVSLPEAANTCGATFDASAFNVDAASATITVNAVNDNNLDISINTTGAVDAEYTTGQPTIYVLWNDIIVGAAPITNEAWTWDSVAGETTSMAYTPPLINCWDGAALPAGDYTIVSAQDVSAATIAPPVSEEPLPTTSPAPSASADPHATVSSDGESTDMAVAAEAWTTIVSAPADFTIAGDAAKDPFAKYLKVVDPAPLPTTPAGPSDALTSDEARAAYEAALTTARWDMAKGTQRVVQTSDSTDPNGDMWSASYYGCPTEGANATFPAKSAELDWLNVNATLPPSVHLSYGWVVDGNPLVSVSAKNVSEWSLPGFYAGSSPRLVLVKDGRVVAEAYPVNPDQSGGGIAYAADSSGGVTSKLIAPNGDGYLAAGDSVGGDYLWRDLSGCWTTTGQLTVAPGTYTVLTAQDIYVGPQYSIMEGSEDGRDGGPAVDVPPAPDGAGANGETGDEAVEPIMAPVDNGDYTSFQIWTSLGSVNVTN